MLLIDPQRKLNGKIGKQKLFKSPEDLLLYSFDATPLRELPSLVVIAETEDDVIQTVLFACENGIPITARGAGSGLSGGSVPENDGIVLSLERMHEIENIDANNKVAVVQPGVVTAELQYEVGKYGLFYPPDPSSHTISTIGGNIAENAGGLRCFKYGVTGHYVLGLEYIDSSGKLCKTGIFDEMNSVPDLTSLLVGSEGTLGIVTKAALRLIYKPQTTVTLAAYFHERDRLFKTVGEIIQAGLVPAVMEYIDREALKAVSEFSKLDNPHDTDALLLLELDGAQAEIDYQLREVKRFLYDSTENVTVASGEDERDKLWKLRRAISPSLIRAATGKIHEDIAVPRGKLSDLSAQITEVSGKYNLPIAVYGHVGDRNLHVVVMYDSDSEVSQNSSKSASHDIFKAAISLGGTITGEHGIGIAKKQFLPWQLSPETISATVKLKSHLDPHRLFNPGKIFNED